MHEKKGNLYRVAPHFCEFAGSGLLFWVALFRFSAIKQMPTEPNCSRMIYNN